MWYSDKELELIAERQRIAQGLPSKLPNLTDEQRAGNRRLVDQYHRMREGFGLPPVTDSEAVDLIMQNNKRAMQWTEEHPIRASVLSEVSEVSGE